MDTLINSKTWARFKREFVGPILTRKQRLAISPKMPCKKDEISKFYIRKPAESKNSKLTKEEIKIIEKKARWSSYIVERRKTRDKSMPPWANKKVIQSIYIKARQLTKETGIKYEVDHIIPSNHPLVCGLHVESNLQILTEYDNIIKSNNFIIE
jgi:hypothetical protein